MERSHDRKVVEIGCSCCGVVLVSWRSQESCDEAIDMAVAMGWTCDEDTYDIEVHLKYETRPIYAT